MRPFLWVAAVAVMVSCGGGSSSPSTGTDAGSGSGGPGVDAGGGNGPPARTWMLRVSASGSGTIVSTPSGIDCGSTCSASFADAARVGLTATPAAGWKFSGWSGACSGTGDCLVTMNAETAVQAAFDQLPPPPVDECAGLTPASLPQSAVASLPDSDCLGGTSDDGNGNFVLGHLAGFDTRYPVYLFFTIKDGQAQRIGEQIQGSDQGTLSVFSQPSGFSAFTFTGYTGASALRSFSHDGIHTSTQEVATARSPSNDSPWSAVAVDPSGGTALVRTQFDNGSWVTSYRRLDKTGSPETDWVSVTSASELTPVRAVGVALSGDVLVMVGDQSATWKARWLTRQGNPITGWFDVAAQAGARELQFLMDGSLAFRSRSPRYPFSAGPWQGRFEDGMASLSPAPQWLQQRTGGKFSVIRNGRAFASWAATGGSCGSNLEVLAVSGKSCGCVTVPNLIEVASAGRDGSLIVPRPEPSVNKCQYDLYPQFLR